jgi:hypothetical protein
MSNTFTEENIICESSISVTSLALQQQTPNCNKSIKYEHVRQTEDKCLSLKYNFCFVHGFP